MKKKRIMAVLMTLAMAMGLAPATALAEGSRDEIQLGTGDIGTNDTIYFGTADYFTVWGYTGKNYPISWQIVDKDKTSSDAEGMFLLSYEEMIDGGLGDQADTWNSSLYEKWTQGEKNAVLSTTVEDTNDYTSTNAVGGRILIFSSSPLNEAKVFSLSAKEAESIAETFRKGNEANTYWLRSKVKSDNSHDLSSANIIGTIDYNQSYKTNYNSGTVKLAYRPAFNLDKTKVLLVSPAEGGKTATALTAVESTDTTEWKLTLLDSNRNGFTASASDATELAKEYGYSDWTVDLSYSAASTGENENEYISAVIVDTDNVVKYYGKIAQSTAENGTASIEIPADLAIGTYTMKVFNEQCNGDQKTDYASNFVDITLTVRPAAPIIAPDGGRIRGEQEVTITAGEGATIYYTTDGTDPTNASTMYESSFNVTPGITLKAVAVKNDLTSDIATATFTKKSSSGGGGGGSSSTTTTTYATTVEKAEHGKVTASPEKAAKGETVTVTATPDAGYQPDKVTVLDRNGDKVELETVKEGEKYTFKMPETKVTVTATFTEVKDETKDETKEEPKDETKDETALPFADVKTNDWFYGDVVYANSNGLLYGTTETTFAPKLSTTRGMIITALHRMEGKSAATAAATFADVADGSYYENAIAWAAENEIAKGYGDGKFGPNDTITREQLAAMLYRYAAFKGIDTTASASLAGFTDGAQASAYAVPALQWAVAEKLVYGDDNGALRPAAQVTRAEAAALLHRFIENVNK